MVGHASCLFEKPLWWALVVEEPPEATLTSAESAESPESPETGGATADAPSSAVVDEGERGFGG